MKISNWKYSIEEQHVMKINHFFSFLDPAKSAVEIYHKIQTRHTIVIKMLSKSYYKHSKYRLQLLSANYCVEKCITVLLLHVQRCRSYIWTLSKVIYTFACTTASAACALHLFTLFKSLIYALSLFTTCAEYDSVAVAFISHPQQSRVCQKKKFNFARTFFFGCVCTLALFSSLCLPFTMINILFYNKTSERMRISTDLETDAAKRGNK